MLGGYKRMETIMTALLVVILVCFIVVAIKGLLDWQHLARARRGPGADRFPADLPVDRRSRATRSGFTQIMAIAGQALPPAVLLSYGYLTANSGYTAADIKTAFWKTVTNLGVVWGMFSVVVIVAGATALHNVYTGAVRCISASATIRRSKAFRSPARCWARRFLARSASSRRGSSRWA